MQSEIPVAPLFVFIYFYTHKVGIRAVINQEDFIRRLQQREKEAFQELFYSWHRPLCFFASRIIKDQDVAEDLVQDVFVAFWKYDLSAFPNEKTIRTFLYTSVRNGCLNYLRDLEIRARNDRKAVPESEEDQDCFLLRQMESEVVTELFEAIDELPERCREIFYMAYLQEKEEKLDERKERILREANEQAHAILRDTKEYADQTMKLFHKFQKDHVDTASVEKERQNLKKRMSKAENGMSSRQQKQKPKKQLKPSDLSLGDTVKVLSLNLKGTVSSHPDSKGYLFVQMGIIRSKVHISDLELVDEPVITTPSMQRTGAGKIRMSKAASISTEINLLGKTVDEAVAELDKYLDDAYIAHMKSVRIVHGKGTGALRKGVHNYLKRQKHVASFRLGEFGEGDAGVTIVEFKK